MNRNLQHIMQKEMTRKEFLVTVGFGFAAILGFSTMIKLITGKSNPLLKSQSLGYGSSTYGGNKS